MDLTLTPALLLLMLVILALSFFWLSRRGSYSARSMRLARGIPEGEVIYSDLDRSAPALSSLALGLSGKPDCIIRTRNGLIPVEMKSGRARKPHRGHILQLAAYCFLVEENYDSAVPYGILVYSDGVPHRIDFDGDLRSELLGTLQEMRSALGNRSLKRGHSQRQKCLSCSYRDSCRSKLT